MVGGKFRVNQTMVFLQSSNPPKQQPHWHSHIVSTSNRVYLFFFSTKSRTCVLANLETTVHKRECVKLLEVRTGSTFAHVSLPQSDYPKYIKKKKAEPRTPHFPFTYFPHNPISFHSSHQTQTQTPHAVQNRPFPFPSFHPNPKKPKPKPNPKTKKQNSLLK